MILDSVLVGPLDPDATYTYTFRDEGTPPDIVYPTSATPIGVDDVPTRTQVVFRNRGNTAQTATFWLLWAPRMTKEQHFVPLTWEGFAGQAAK